MSEKPNAVLVPLASIVPSPLNPRRDFDKVELASLAASIRENGVLQPILLRPAPGGAAYEIVAGERRWRASKDAGIDRVPAIVREIPDDQVRQVQIVENIQRAELHPLELADAYLSLTTTGLTPKDVAAKVGRQVNHVYATLKLAALSPKARKHYLAGRISHYAALRIARIPNDKLRDEAAEHVASSAAAGQAMTPADVDDYIEGRFMLRLDEAPFPKDDETLVPGTPTCAACPKRTGNQRQLWADVKSADVCVDAECWGAKRQAALERIRQKAAAQGTTVIDGKQAKELLPYEGCRPKGYVLLDDHCPQDPKRRSYRALLGQHNTDRPVLIETSDHKGDVQAYVEALPAEKAAALLRARGVGVTAKTVTSDPAAVAQRSAERKAREETAYRRRLHEEIRKHARKLSLQDLPRLAAAFYAETSGDTHERLARLSGRKEPLIRTAVAKLPPAEALGLMLDLTLAPQTRVGVNYSPDASDLEAFARKFKIDTAALRKELSAPTPKKAGGKGRRAA